jgi:DNA-binding NarL/FixJ family response regulator
MGARITELILRRESALSLLKRASGDVYVRAAIMCLEGDPDAGEPGGPARDSMPVLTPPRTPVRTECQRPVPQTQRSLDVKDRATEIVKCISEGMTNEQIARQLYISEDTVKTHIRRLLKRFGARNRTALVTAAREGGLS